MLELLNEVCDKSDQSPPDAAIDSLGTVLPHHEEESPSICDISDKSDQSPGEIVSHTLMSHMSLLSHAVIENSRAALTTHLLDPVEQPLEENPTSDERKIAELIARYQAGQFNPKVRTRLAKRFQQNPPNIEARLLTACDYVGVTGKGLEEADRLAQQAYEAAGWPWLEVP